MRLITLVFLTLWMAVSTAWAEGLTVEAEGRGLIQNQDLESARQAALRDATQQAMLQAGAQVSSTQRIDQGILTIDNLRVRTLGSISNVRVLDEEVRGGMLVMRIRADVAVEESCGETGPGQNYLKSVAVAAFPLLERRQANRGALHDVEQGFAKALGQRIGAHGDLRSLNASHLQVHDPLVTAATRQEPHGAITDTLTDFDDLDVQFIVSGVIRDIGMFDPAHNRNNNLFIDWYDRLDPLGRQHLRNFAVDVFVHDGFTGALLFNRSYRQAGSWNLEREARTGFNSPAFTRTDYGRKVSALLDQVSHEINNQLKCEPFRARIVAAQGNTITFNAGSVVGVRPGDKLTVLRRSTFYDQQDSPHIRLEHTGNTLVVNQVHPLFSSGNIAVDTAQRNIQQDDVVMAW